VSLLAAAMRMNRFELRAIGALALAVFLGGVLFAVRLLLFDIPDACFGAGADTPACLPRARDLVAYGEIVSTGMTIVFGALVMLPIVGGLLVGISLVGKEIDQRTATFAWSVGPDRRRWLLLRVVPTVLLLVVVTLAVSLFDTWLISFASRSATTELTFDRLGLRDLSTAGAALSVFGISLFVGAVIGRVLPALLLAGGFVICAYVGVSIVNDRFLQNEAIVVDISTAPPGRTIEDVFETPDGERLGWDEAFSRFGYDMAQWPTSIKQFARMNVYETYPLVDARMALLHGVLGLATITLAFAVVARRKP
jgi:hypothetical protein